MNKKTIIFIIVSICILIMILFISLKDSQANDKDALDNIDINMLLNEPKETYKKYHHQFIKVTGKISKISGNSAITLQAYIKDDNEINGHVVFNETSKLTIYVNGLDVSNYRIYDYITITGFLSDYVAKKQELILTKCSLEENPLYDKYEIQLTESRECNNYIKKYFDNLYTYCVDNIYLDYKVDKYELSYALKDQKISLESLYIGAKYKLENGYKIYELEKLNILLCDENKQIIFNKHKKMNYSFCKE